MEKAPFLSNHSDGGNNKVQFERRAYANAARKLSSSRRMFKGQEKDATHHEENIESSKHLPFPSTPPSMAGMMEDIEVANEYTSLIKTPIKYNTHHSDAVLRDAKPEGKVSYALFERIVVLYPESAYSLLRSDQIPTPLKLKNTKTPDGSPFARSSALRISSMSRVDESSDMSTPKKTLFLVEDTDVDGGECDEDFENEEFIPFSRARSLFTPTVGRRMKRSHSHHDMSPRIPRRLEMDRVEEGELREEEVYDRENMQPDSFLQPSLQAIYVTSENFEDDETSCNLPENSISERNIALDEEKCVSERHESGSSLCARDGSMEHNFDLPESCLPEEDKTKQDSYHENDEHDALDGSESSNASNSDSYESFPDEDESQIYSFSKESMQNMSHRDDVSALFHGRDTILASPAIRVASIDMNDPRFWLGEISLESSRFGDADEEAVPIHSQHHTKIERSAVRELFSGTDEASSSGHNSEEGPKPFLRRSIASRRRSFVDIAGVSHRDRESDCEEVEEIETEFGSEEDGPDITSVDSFPLEQELGMNARPKGIVMRSFSRDKARRGIQRAETGVILSHAERLRNKSEEVCDDPNPKSFHANAFKEANSVSSYDGEEEDSREVVVVDYNKGNEMKKSAFYEGDRVLSPRSEGRGRERYGSARGSRRLSVRRVSEAFRWRSRRGAPESGRTRLVLDGAAKDIIQRILHICRNHFRYDVYVKETGRKIRVESEKGSGQTYLRASILVTERLEASESCDIKVRASRSDGLKTSAETMWNFYTSLRAELLEAMERNGRGWITDGLFESEK